MPKEDKIDEVVELKTTKVESLGKDEVKTLKEEKKKINPLGTLIKSKDSGVKIDPNKEIEIVAFVPTSIVYTFDSKKVRRVFTVPEHFSLNNLHSQRVSFAEFEAMYRATKTSFLDVNLYINDDEVLEAYPEILKSSEIILLLYNNDWMKTDNIKTFEKNMKQIPKKYKNKLLNILHMNADVLKAVKDIDKLDLLKKYFEIEQFELFPIKEQE